MDRLRFPSKQQSIWNTRLRMLRGTGICMPPVSCNRAWAYTGIRRCLYTYSGKTNQRRARFYSSDVCALH